MRAVSLLLVVLPLAACQPPVTSIPGRSPDPRGPIAQPDVTPPHEEQAPYVFGWVRDGDGFPLAGIGVREKDRRQGARSNDSGYFFIQLNRVPSGQIVHLIAEGVGYQSVEMPVVVHPGANEIALSLSRVEPAEAKVVAADSTK